MQGLTQRVAALPNVDDFFWEKDPTPILDTIDAPIHLKNLSSKVVRVIPLLGFLSRNIYDLRKKMTFAYLIKTGAQAVS